MRVTTTKKETTVKRIRTLNVNDCLGEYELTLRTQLEFKLHTNYWDEFVQRRKKTHINSFWACVRTRTNAYECFFL